MAKAYVVGTFDTKGAELRYVAGLLAARHEVVTVDVSTSGAADSGADVPAAEVAAHHPDGPGAVFTGQRGSAVAAMSTALRRFLPGRAPDGVLGLGGSGGTALITPALRDLPIGVPKAVVSTVASGDVSAYVDASDIAMFPSVTDVAGLNRISRTVLGNAAHALLGALAHPVPAGEDRPAVALSMFGVTTPCVSAVAERLRAEHDPLVFHATGVGGRALDNVVGTGMVRAALDLTTTEVADLVAGGVMSAGEQRFDAAARTGVPFVASCGALDMVNFGPLDTVPAHYRDRLLHEHNAQVTLMRTTPEECRAIAEFLARKLNAHPGPVRLLLPEGGVSALDAPGEAFHDPAADAVLFDELERQVRTGPGRIVRRVPHHLNDPGFADAVIAAFHEVTTPAEAM
ncbi:Tm-1-like ATP-binding domain-containing protein [Saccharopolyspora cebuensis]|uniref:Tm-1-like ATP-binding domain-containing protein n=1 Tax=Saccharopolyspora cebuensis TaxID=418759 RepID=A0ABV4CPV8_9PSEU